MTIERMNNGDILAWNAQQKTWARRLIRWTMARQVQSTIFIRAC